MRVVSLAAEDYAEWSPYYVRLSPVSVLHVALLLLVVANVGRIPLLNLGERQAPILINDLCVGAAVATGAIFVLYARSLRLNDVALFGLLFACIGGLSALSAIPRFGLSGIEIVASLAYLARWMLYFVLYIVIINCVRAKDAESLWSALERAMLVIAAAVLISVLVTGALVLLALRLLGGSSMADARREAGRIPLAIQQGGAHGGARRC